MAPINLELSSSWRRMFDALPDLVTVLDQEHRMIWLNSAMAARLKISREEAIGTPGFRLFHGSAQSACGCSPWLTNDKPDAQFVESTIVGLEGIFLISASPLLDEAGQLAGCLQVARDITQRRHLEDELRWERDLTAAILENMDALMVVLDHSGHIVHVNRTYESLTGHQAGEKKGKPFWEVLPLAEEQEKIREALAALKRGESGARYETWFIKEEKRRLISWSNTTIRRPGGILQYIIATGLDITEQYLAQTSMDRLAHFDILTDLPNRKLFADRLQRAMARARRYRTLVAVLFLDLDEFKPVNDNFGHDTGDLMLVEVAGRLRESMRETDTIGRMGGDEFVAAIENLHRKEDVDPVARKIIAALTRPFVLKNATCKIGVSIGVAFFPEHGEEMEGLVKKADQAMYEAKKEGNTYRLYEERYG